MTDPYGLHVQFTAQPGKADDLEAILVKAAEGALAAEDCLIYFVARVADDPDAVWVTEAWTSKEAHDAGLEDEGARELIKHAMPLLAGRPVATELRPS